MRMKHALSHFQIILQKFGFFPASLQMHAFVTLFHFFLLFGFTQEFQCHLGRGSTKKDLMTNGQPSKGKVGSSHQNQLSFHPLSIAKITRGSLAHALESLQKAAAPLFRRFLVQLNGFEWLRCSTSNVGREQGPHSFVLFKEILLLGGSLETASISQGAQVHREGSFSLGHIAIAGDLGGNQGVSAVGAVDDFKPFIEFSNPESFQVELRQGRSSVQGFLPIAGGIHHLSLLFSRFGTFRGHLVNEFGIHLLRFQNSLFQFALA
mmetsp:Transcript_5522/g.11722  ORF Transcript_5522/g.11722 Transcript_5522/m.11722 type:complete len:264 (+) Transcript_5522:454-1245(+)